MCLGGEWRASGPAIAMIVLISALVTGVASADQTAIGMGCITPFACLQQRYASTGSFTAKFTETLSVPGGPPRERSGRIAYRKGGKIRWEFDQPTSETIVADGSTLYDYDPGLNQVVEMPLAEAFKSRSAAAFILGVGNLERDFDYVSATESTADDLIHLTVTPKDGADKIELGIDRNSGNITTMQVADALGNKTLLKFSDIQLNVPISASSFSFTPPAGADIVTAPHPK